MQSEADLKSMYAMVTDWWLEREMVQSLMLSRRLVVVECRFKKPC